MNTTSESLLFRLQQHVGSDEIDQSAWENFVGLYTPLMLHWARKVGLKQPDAADLIQEVLAIVFRRLPDLKYDRQGSFRGWLRTVTLNKFRERRRKKTLPFTDESASFVEGLASVPQAESTWDLDYGRLLLTQAMDQMQCDFEPATWQALLAVMRENLSVEQASKQHAVSPWTIYSARSRLMRRLRDQLDGML
ncbi:sigma-70 family RNA polymerase sigma factor [Mariniblastus sp.]|nr:sigma-70 family RNA polymerase sigma factor [Mariniblastus sp.]